MKITKILIVVCWFLNVSLIVTAVVCFKHKDWTNAICNVLWMFISLMQTRNMHKLHEREVVQAKLNEMIEKADKASKI